MTTFADGEVISAECPFAVVTSRATLATAGGVVVERLGLRNLPALWHAGANLMAFITGSFFVLLVTEADAKRLRKLRSAGIAAKLMARAARRDVAATRLRARHVTAVARAMRIETGRN